MARFILALLVIVPAILAAEKKGRAYPLPVSGSQQAGAAVGQYGNVQQGSENHDKKNFGLNFSSDKGSSQNYQATNAAAAASGAQQQGHGYVPGGYPYPYPGGWPSYPPHYPTYPYGPSAVGAGAGITGYPGGQHIGAGAGAIGPRY